MRQLTTAIAIASGVLLLAACTKKEELAAPAAAPVVTPEPAPVAMPEAEPVPAPAPAAAQMQSDVGEEADSGGDKVAQ